MKHAVGRRISTEYIIPSCIKMYNLRQNLPTYNIYGFKSDFYQMEQITHTLRLQRSALQRGFVAFMLLQSRTHNTFLCVVVVI